MEGEACTDWLAALLLECCTVDGGTLIRSQRTLDLGSLRRPALARASLPSSVRASGSNKQ